MDVFISTSNIVCAHVSIARASSPCHTVRNGQRVLTENVGAHFAVAAQQLRHRS